MGVLTLLVSLRIPTDKKNQNYHLQEAIAKSKSRQLQRHIDSLTIDILVTH